MPCILNGQQSCLVARTEVGVRVRSLVPVHVEKPVVEVLVIVAASVETRVR